MIIRKPQPRTLRPDEPIRHEGVHKRPVTRRDFLAQGITAGLGTVIAPTVFGLFANPREAAAALSPDLEALRASCGIEVLGAGKIPFICIDLAGGANMVGSNVLVGGPGGQLDFLSTAGYGKLDLAKLILVGVDCLSTYDPDYWRRGNELHAGSPDWLVDEALALARTGQVRTDGYRLACELCDRPSADYRAADVLVGLVGVANQETILILADETRDARWRLQALTDRQATERETVDREVTLWRLGERRKEAAAARLESLGLADAYPGVIMGYMRKCTLCGECIDACPQWSEELRAAVGRGKEAFLQALLNATQRLASCSGCGMCQVHCPEGIPLSAIQRALSQQIQQRMHYIAGRDVHEPLPWSV